VTTSEPARIRGGGRSGSIDGVGLFTAALPEVPLLFADRTVAYGFSSGAGKAHLRSTAVSPTNGAIKISPLTRAEAEAEPVAALARQHLDRLLAICWRPTEYGGQVRSKAVG